MGVRGRALIAGNWKMNALQQDGLALADALDSRARQGHFGRDPGLSAGDPAGAARPAPQAGGPIKLGAQDCHDRRSGAFTGDISAQMASRMPAAAMSFWAILPSRRAGHGETDDIVRAKAMAALAEEA